MNISKDVESRGWRLGAGWMISTSLGIKVKQVQIKVINLGAELEREGGR